MLVVRSSMREERAGLVGVFCYVPASFAIFQGLDL